MLVLILTALCISRGLTDRPARDCSDGNQADYRGDASVTWSGKQCQKWTAQKPNQHDYDPDDWPGEGLGFHNKCRNPSGLGRRAWCYIKDRGDSADRWEYCAVPRCTPLPADPECASGDQSNYRGTMSVTSSGFTCQNWLAQTPREHEFVLDESKGIGDHNYCRNPDNMETGAWCFTVDDPDEDWDFCGVPRC